MLFLRRTQPSSELLQVRAGKQRLIGIGPLSANTINSAEVLLCLTTVCCSRCYESLIKPTEVHGKKGKKHLALVSQQLQRSGMLCLCLKQRGTARASSSFAPVRVELQGGN